MIAKLSNGREIHAEMILASIGRSMNSGNLGLDIAGVATGKRGEITVDDRRETKMPGIYAVGDITGKMLLAPAASHQGLVAVENTFGGNETMDCTVVKHGTTPTF